MSSDSSIFVNSYIPPYVKDDLKWYERDGLLTYVDRLKYERFEENRDDYLTKAKVVNFHMIHARCRGNTREKNDRHYQTVKYKNLKKMSEEDKKKAVAACIRNDRKDLYVQKDLMIDYFKTL